MAKTRHQSVIETVNEIIEIAKSKDIVHLVTDKQSYVDDYLPVKGDKLLNFGTCGYLSLESDPRLISGSIEATRKFGTQFSVSRTYLTSGLNEELEELLALLFGAPAIVFSSTTLAHISCIPIVVDDDDAVILDQQVHVSVQNACQLLKPRQVPIDMIRHNNLEMLEEKIKVLHDKHSKIWYMIDGVYSMYGDFPPIKELIKLQEKYEKLHIYVDDAHGMSWKGPNGGGFILSQINLTSKIFLTTTMGKGFGCLGGVAVFSDPSLFRKVKLWGGALTYSHPIAPGTIGAAIESAKIHLSPEIYTLQDELSHKIKYCDWQLRKRALPLISDSETPIFFVGVSKPSVGYNLVNRMMKDGYFMNIGIFPAVPIKNTGIRFTLNRKLSMENISSMAEVLEDNFYKALEEESLSKSDIFKAFKLKDTIDKREVKNEDKQDQIEHYETIQKIDKELWDQYFSEKGIFDWEGMKFMESAFSGNSDKFNNWDFHYYIVKREGKIVLATFFTLCYWKEDMLAPTSVSEQVEKKRKEDPMFLTSKAFMMGSLFSEGEQLYIDRTQSDWKQLLKGFLNFINKEQDKFQASAMVLRDFEENDKEIRELLQNEGYVRVKMPETSVIKELTWQNEEEFLDRLTPRSKRHVKYDVIKNEPLFEVVVKQSADESEINDFYQLFMNVHGNNLDVNLFPYPRKVVSEMSNFSKWEYVCIYLKSDYERNKNVKPIGVFFGYNNGKVYIPELVGFDYCYLNSHKIYKQCLYQMVKRARALNCEKIHLGLTASLEKKKLGAEQVSKVAYFQAKDNFSLEMLSIY